MDEIRIPHSFLAELPSDLQVIEVGTLLSIEALQLDWAGKLPGRPSLGRSTSRLGRLREDLELLLRPLDLSSADFRVEIRSDAVVEEADVGVISPRSAAEVAPYRYDFEYYLTGSDKPTVRRTLSRNSSIAREFGKKRRQEVPGGPLTARNERGPAEEGPLTLTCGPFSGTFLYRPPPKRARAKTEDVVGHGVLLYRDNVLVEPYGLGENDWVGVEARKAQRQGHALIQPATFWGEVRIARSRNRALRDMANRQGLLENQQSEEFFAHVRREFRIFEDIVGTELETRWTSREEKAAEVAKEQIRAVTLRIKSVAHNLRQPLMGMAGELLRLKRLTEDPDIPSDRRDRLSAIHEKLLAYHARTERLVNKYASGAVPKFEITHLPALAESIHREAQDQSRAHGVNLRTRPAPDREFVIPRDLVEEAILELVVNAIEAPRPPGRSPEVTLVLHAVRQELLVDIVDNGTGLPGVKPGTPLDELRLASTKGRPADGIVQVCSVLAFARGTAEVLETSPTGTHIRVRIIARLRN
jgi:signal transduction histidine kinase